MIVVGDARRPRVRLLVTGASGRTGTEVVRLALVRGHMVTALARRPRRLGLADPGLRVIEGDLRDAAVVASALDGADAVVSAIGPRSGTEASTEASDGTRTLVDEMTIAGVDRLLIIVNTSVFTDVPVAAPFAVVADEHRRNVATLADSGLAWTVAAPHLLSDDPPAGYETRDGEPAPGRSISRADLAAFLVDAAEQGTHVGRLVGLSSRPT